MPERGMPPIDTRAAASGAALSIVVSIGAELLGFPAFGAVIGALAGGYAAGRLAGRDGLLHGGIVGVIDVVGLAIAATVASATVANVLADTVSTLIGDVVLLVSGAAGGWLATRS